MSVRTRPILAALLCALVVCTAALGQSVNYTTGSIGGTVRDKSGAGLPGVMVTATSLATGLTRTTYTDKDGAYDFGLLPPGDYRVQAQLQGLGESTVPGVTVLLGNTTRADLKLAPQISETMAVTGAAPVIDTQRTGTTQSVTNNQIESLPLLGRDFRTLALLTPGVTVGSYDSVSITANGARPLSTDYNIDGASSNNDFYGQQTGGTNPPFTFSQAAIQEFQVIKSQYDSEYGRGVGAAVNAITKSGTNEFHGEAFFYDRLKSWAATRPTAFDTNIGGTTYALPVSDSFLAKTVQQPGFVVGGPIVKDKVFFFAGFDSMTQSQPYTVGNDMRQSAQFLALTPSQQQAVLQKFQSAFGVPYSAGLNYNVDNTLHTYLAKFDGNLAENHHWSLRGDDTNYSMTNTSMRSSFGLNETDETDKFYQIVGELDSVLSSSVFNQAIAQIGRDQRPVSSLYSATEFSINFGESPLQYFGAADTTPSTADEKKYQFKDTVQYQWGDHSLKGGVELLHRDLFDEFPRYANGYYQYNSLLDFFNGNPYSFTQAYGPNNGNLNWTTNLWGAYVNDSFRLSPRLTLDLGLRYDYEATPRPSSNAYPQYPQFLTQIHNDTTNLAPRVSFAWDVAGDGRSVLRGGTGKFYEYMPDILLAAPLQGISGALITTTFTCSKQPCPTYPNIFPPAQFLANSALGANLVTIGPNYQAQEAWRTSLQYEQRLGDRYSAGVSAVYSHLTHIEGTQNVNLVPTGYSLGNMPVYDYSSSTNPNRPYPTLGVIRELTSNEQAWYREQTIEFHKLPNADSKWSWDISYTHANSIDDETNTRSTSTTFLIDPNNPSLSEGPSDNDIEHRVVTNLTYRLPYGFEVSAIAFWHSGYPYTAAISFTCTGGCSANSLTGQAQTSQAAQYTPVFVNGNGQIIDITQASGMTLPQFSAWLALQDARLIGRNTLRQPSVYDADIRISKTFNLINGVKVQVLGEVFNLLNHNIDVVTGANQDLFRVSYSASTGKYTITKYTNTVQGTALNTFGLVEGYSGEVNPRQVQAAIKISF